MTTPFQSSAFGALTPEQQARLLEAVSLQRLNTPTVPKINDYIGPATSRRTLADRAEDFALSAFGSDPRGRRRTDSVMDTLGVLDPGFMLA